MEYVHYFLTGGIAMKMCGRKIPKIRRIPKISWRTVCAAAVTICGSFLLLAEGQRPFAPSVAAAALCAGINPWGVLCGSAAGALLSGQYHLLLGAASCCIICKLLKRGNSEMRAALAAMAGTLTNSLCAGGNWLTIAASACLACALSPALVCGFQIRLERAILMPEEKLSFGLIWLLFLAGLACVHPWGAVVAGGAASLAAIAAARKGAAFGALAGLLSGAACLSGPEFPVILGAGAAAAGALRGMNRWPSAAGFLAASALTAFCLGETSPVMLAAIPAGLLAFCLLGEKRIPIVALLSAPEDSGDRRKLLEARRSVEGMRQALSEYARTCAAGSLPDNGISVVPLMRERLCSGCTDYARCWNGKSPEAGRLFSQLAARLDTGENPEELPPDQVRFCRRAPQIGRRLTGVYAAAEQKRCARRERSLAAQMSAAPLQKAVDLLQELENGLCRAAEEDVYGAQSAAGWLDRHGETACGLSVSAGPQMAVEFCQAVPGWDTDHLKRVAGLLSHALGGNYSAQSRERFVRVPAIRVSAGVCSREASSGSPCGDRALCAPLGDGRTALILSDGMGRGADAADESRCVVTLLHRLLLAGAQPRPAIDAVNSMMRLRSGEKFATLDLCIIDPYKGEASFYKLGACLSVLLRKKVCLRVEGGRLPPGVVEPAEPSVSTLRLRHGDTIVMVTDGVADFAREGQEDWLTTTISTLNVRSADELAHGLVRAALKREKGRPGDDMTALCARIIAEK